MKKANPVNAEKKHFPGRRIIFLIFLSIILSLSIRALYQERKKYQLQGSKEKRKRLAQVSLKLSEADIYMNSQQRITANTPDITHKCAAPALEGSLNDYAVQVKRQNVLLKERIKFLSCRLKNKSAEIFNLDSELAAVKKVQQEGIEQIAQLKAVNDTLTGDISYILKEIELLRSLESPDVYGVKAVLNGIHDRLKPKSLESIDVAPGDKTGQSITADISKNIK